MTHHAMHHALNGVVSKDKLRPPNLESLGDLEPAFVIESQVTAVLGSPDDSEADAPSEEIAWQEAWEHVKVTDAQEWHTTSRGRGPSKMRGVQSDPLLQKRGSLNGASGSLPTPRSSTPNLFRRSDRLTNETFDTSSTAAHRLLALQDTLNLEVPPTAPTMAPVVLAGSLSRSGDGSGSLPSPKGGGGFQMRVPRSQSVHTSGDAFVSNPMVMRRLNCKVAHGLTQAEFAVRREGKLLACLVGLPARGKTYIAQAIMRHMEWNELPTRLFNAGNYRRRVCGAQTPAAFFDANNPEGAAMRQKCAELALQDALDALASAEGIFVAIFDATNTTRRRRSWVKEVVEKHPAHVQLVFIETVLTDDAQVWKNVKNAKLKSPDYQGMDPEAAMKDFMERIARYKSVYEPVARDESVPFIRLTNAGEELLSYRANGHLPGRVLSVMNVMRLRLQPILLTRCGESDNEAQGYMGGDALLTPVGQLYASRLHEAVAQLVHPIVWTSTRMRARQTTAPLANRWPVLGLAALDEIDTGLVTGLTYAQYAKAFPESYVERQSDKLRGRFPAGESYLDVYRRLEPLLLELLAEPRPVVVVAHLGVLRVIYGYLMGVPPSESVNLVIPMHCVLKLTPSGYGYEEWRHFPLR